MFASFFYNFKYSTLLKKKNVSVYQIFLKFSNDFRENFVTAKFYQVTFEKIRHIFRILQRTLEIYFVIITLNSFPKYR